MNNFLYDIIKIFYDIIEIIYKYEILISFFILRKQYHENKVFKAHSQNTFISTILIQFYFSFLPKQKDTS